MKPRIKSTTLTIILCIVLTFGASLMTLSEWHYKENNLSTLVFKLLSIFIILAYSISYINLIINIFEEKGIKKRKTTENVILIIYFVAQSLFTILIFLGLLLVTLGIW